MAHIAVGATYLEECPQEPYIPIYLVVLGVFGLVVTLLSWLPCAWCAPSPTPFVLCWFIAGNVWIYRIYEPNYVKNETVVDPTYCNKTVYLFTFWTIALIYILLGAVLVGGCCVVFCVFRCFCAKPSTEPATDPEE